MGRGLELLGHQRHLFGCAVNQLLFQIQNTDAILVKVEMT